MSNYDRMFFPNYFLNIFLSAVEYDISLKYPNSLTCSMWLRKTNVAMCLGVSFLIYKVKMLTGQFPSYSINICLYFLTGEFNLNSPVLYAVIPTWNFWFEFVHTLSSGNNAIAIISVQVFLEFLALLKQ